MLWSTRPSASTSTDKMADDRFEVIVWILNPGHFELAVDEEGRQVLMHSTKVVGQDVHHT